MFVHPRITILSAHHDGELSSSVAARVESHLKECSDCRVEYEKLSSAANAVRHLRTRRAPSYLAVKVREQIDAEERGMVPVLREEILRSRRQGGFFSALGLGTLATILLIGLVLMLDHRYGEQAARRLTSAWIQATLPDPVLMLNEPMSSPRFRDGSVASLPLADMESGREGTFLSWASIDRNGDMQEFQVIYSDGDPEMLSRALNAVRTSGFEPARLNNETVSVNFLYLFTTTEVRPGVRRLSTLPLTDLSDSYRFRSRA